MPRKRKQAALVLAPVCDDSQPQPELFSPDAYPVRPDLVQMVKGKSFLHTGAHLTKDEELCRGVCADLVLGASDRAIAKKWRISRNSIIGIEMAMRARGELEPLKQEISGLLGEVIVMGLRNYRDALAGGLINPAQIPIPMGVFIDKKGQLDGNVIPGTQLKAPELTADQVAKEIEAMQAESAVDIEASVAPSETQSDVPPSKHA